MALHPDLVAFKDLYDQGQMAVIQGVGYPNPNRSHFRVDGNLADGGPDASAEEWLAGSLLRCAMQRERSEDSAPDPKAAVNIGSTAPLALQGNKFAAVSFQNPQSYQWFAGNKGVDKRMRDTFDSVNDLKTAKGDMVSSGNPTLDFLERTALDAQLSSDEILAVTTRYKGGVVIRARHWGSSCRWWRR